MSEAALKILPKDDPDAVCGDGLDTAAKSIYFDKGAKKFWFQGLHGEWIGYDKQFAQLYLKQFKDLNGGASKGEKISDMERELLRVAMEDYVSYAGPLAGWKKGFYQTGGERILVTRSPKPMEPSPGEFPTIKRMLACLLGGEEIPDNGDEECSVIDQREYLYSWWRFALDCLNSGNPRNGLALVLAGDAGCGKTLLKDLIKMSFGGREAYPYSFMIGRDNFNAEMLEAESWTIDDEQADTKMTARVKFGAEMKIVVASSAMRFRGMMREAVTLSTFKRIVICVNRESEALKVLPPMADDIKGKISLLMAYNSKMFHEIEQNGSAEYAQLNHALTDELPHFIYWLMNDYKPDVFGQARFGSREFHHPDLMTELFDMSPEYVVMEQIERCLASHFLCNSVWEGSSLALRDIMALDDGPLSSSEIKNLPSPGWLSRGILKKLAKRFPGRFIHKHTAGGNIWTIYEK